jgi:hypothetical protein
MSDKDEVLYVPNPGMNYYPKGAPEVLEGAVPNHPVNDQQLQGIRANLYAQGLSDGGPTPDPVNIEPNSVSRSAPFEPEPTGDESSESGLFDEDPPKKSPARTTK